MMGPPNLQRQAPLPLPPCQLLPTRQLSKPSKKQRPSACGLRSAGSRDFDHPLDLREANRYNNPEVHNVPFCERASVSASRLTSAYAEAHFFLCPQSVAHALSCVLTSASIASSSAVSSAVKTAGAGRPNGRKFTPNTSCFYVKLPNAS